MRVNLFRVRQIRKHANYGFSTSRLAGVRHQHHFHQSVVNIVRYCLYNVRVSSTHRFLQMYNSIFLRHFFYLDVDICFSVCETNSFRRWNVDLKPSKRIFVEITRFLYLVAIFEASSLFEFPDKIIIFFFPARRRFIFSSKFDVQIFILRCPKLPERTEGTVQFTVELLVISISEIENVSRGPVSLIVIQWWQNSYSHEIFSFFTLQKSTELLTHGGGWSFLMTHPWKINLRKKPDVFSQF